MGQSIIINFDSEDLNTARARSATDLRNQDFAQFVAGDALVLDLFLTGTSGLLNIQDYAEVRVGIGDLDARPTSGTYSIDTSNTLNYNHSASELESIIDSDVAAATVTRLSSFVFKVQFDAAGAQTIPAIDSRLLTPSSTVSVTKLVTGDATTKETWLWRIYQNPAAFTKTFTNISGDGVRGTLSLATSGIYDLLGISSAVKTFFEVELTDSSGNVQTVLQSRVKLNGEVIGHNFTGSIPVSPSIPPSATDFLESFPEPTIMDQLTIKADKSPDENAVLEMVDKSTPTALRGALEKINGVLYVGPSTVETDRWRFQHETGTIKSLNFPTNAGLRLGRGGSFLNYYDEGQFTPKLESGDGSVVQNDYDRMQANYVRIGDLVQINIYISISDFTTAWKTSTKNWRITGLPFDAIGFHNIEIRPVKGWLDLGNDNITGSLGSGNNYLWVEKFIDGGTTAGQGANTSRINGNSFNTHPFNFSSGGTNAFQFIVTGAYKTDDA